MDALRHLAINLSEPILTDSILKLVKEQFKRDIPILTINVSDAPQATITELIDLLQEKDLLAKHQAKVVVLGDWYSLEPPLVDAIKLLMDVTADYDRYFITFCIRYTGRAEIKKAVRLLAKRAQEGRVSADHIDEDIIKENLPSSYYVPPDIIIETGSAYSGLLLWDSPGSIIYHDPGWKEALSKALNFRKKVLYPSSRSALKPLGALRKKNKE